MKKILEFLYSTKITIILLLFFAFVIGFATFIEDKYDTFTAKSLVYNTTWFEVMLVLLILNLFGHLTRYKMVSLKKIAGLTFHLAFVLMILGSCITRYIGFEGAMHIREGETSHTMYVSEPYFQVKATVDGKAVTADKAFFADVYVDNTFNVTLDLAGKGTLELKYNKFIPNAEEHVYENMKNGKTMLEFLYSDEKGRQKKLITQGTTGTVGNCLVAFDEKDHPGVLSMKEQNGKVYFKYPESLVITSMVSMSSNIIPPDSLTEVTDNTILKSKNFMIIFSKKYTRAVARIESSEGSMNSEDAMLVEATLNGKTDSLYVFGSPQTPASFQDFTLNGVPFQMAYGEKAIELPFSINLNDFILDRYAGSMSPSSYESKVTLIDDRKGLREDHRIYMNNVLDYDGFRFFQSSYDQDEHGTILSVNHDFWGTLVTYIGYLLMAIGFMLVLVTNHTRFAHLKSEIKKIREKRKALATLALLFLGLTISATASPVAMKKTIDKEHAEKFGHLLVQSYEGRFQPVHSLAIDAIHKISRKDNITLPEKGELTDIQVFMDMFMNPEFWKEQKIIYLPDKVVRERLGIHEKYAAFSEFFDDKGQYKLSEYAETAFRKTKKEQNAFDKEVLKIDERLNVMMMVFQGSMLKIFPVQGSPTHQWTHWNDSTAFFPIGGVASVINQDLHLNPFNYHNLLLEYFTQIYKATESGDYTNADKVLEYIKALQRQATPADMLPDESKVNLEIFYNKANIFSFLRNVYGILSLLLLTLAFIENLRVKKSKWLTRALNFFIVLLGIAFLYHTYGMGLRWYLSEHAPWSNGYEALLLVAWGGILAGFTFVRYSRITVAATSVLAFAMLMTAGHSSYDPQLTNLVPVLKSYWLIIHVASITISYGFLGLGFFLGIINMFLYVFANNKNRERTGLLIQELTYINEMNLTVGLALATIGTFLGGVWANESWGRYWGWDAKETWALVIVLVYAAVLHLRLMPKLKGTYLFNISSIISFGTVLMTFVGVNYYLSKGMHSYGSGDTPVFPIWAWIMIFALILLMVVAGIMHYKNSKKSLE